jgi:hypothetical protein
MSALMSSRKILSTKESGAFDRCPTLYLECSCKNKARENNIRSTQNIILVDEIHNEIIRSCE